jgi:hypothetical protein
VSVEWIFEIPADDSLDISKLAGVNLESAAGDRLGRSWNADFGIASSKIGLSSSVGL